VCAGSEPLALASVAVKEFETYTGSRHDEMVGAWADAIRALAGTVAELVGELRRGASRAERCVDVPVLRGLCPGAMERRGVGWEDLMLDYVPALGSVFESAVECAGLEVLTAAYPPCPVEMAELEEALCDGERRYAGSAAHYSCHYNIETAIDGRAAVIAFGVLMDDATCTARAICAVAAWGHIGAAPLYLPVSR
jgi:hypothetical protein